MKIDFCRDQGRGLDVEAKDLTYEAKVEDLTYKDFKIVLEVKAKAQGLQHYIAAIF